MAMPCMLVLHRVLTDSGTTEANAAIAYLQQKKKDGMHSQHLQGALGGWGVKRGVGSPWLHYHNGVLQGCV